MLSWTSDLPMTTSYGGMVTLPEGRPFRGLEVQPRCNSGEESWQSQTVPSPRQKSLAFPISEFGLCSCGFLVDPL